MAQGDVERCFYQFAMPYRMRRYFCTPAISARSLPGRLRMMLGVGPDDQVRFQTRVVPMGWSWSVAWVQAAHEEVFLRPGMPGPWLLDKHLSRELRHGLAVAAKALYIDSFAAFGCDSEASPPLGSR